MELGRGVEKEEEEGWVVFNLQDAACAGAPEPRHLPGFTQGLVNRSAFSLVFSESSTSGPCLLMLLLLMWLLFVFYRVSGGCSSRAAQGGGR